MGTAAGGEGAGAGADTVAAGAVTAAGDEGAGEEIRKIPKPGDSLEVWWQDHKKYYSCVVAEQVPDLNDITASLCIYDDDDTGKDYWHDLEDVVYRRIPPEMERLRKVKDDVLLSRLIAEGVSCREKDKKAVLVQKLFDKLSGSPVVGAGAPRSKHAQSHKDRVQNNKRKREDRERVALEQKSKKFARDTKKVSNGAKKFVNQVKEIAKVTSDGRRTVSQSVQDIGSYGMAMYTLATRGDRRDDRQHERENYNLMVFSQASMGEGSHVWKVGDTDMTLLPSKVKSIYDTTGWVCINRFADGDRFVLKRPAPPIPVRGSGTQRRRVPFVWTLEMGQWLDNLTSKYSFKSIAFADLVKKADAKWGYLAPPHHVLENKIKSRDTARKRGDTVRWIKQYKEAGL